MATGGQAGTSARIENYLGFPAGISGSELTQRAGVQAIKFGVRLTSPAKAERLTSESGQHSIELSTGAIIAHGLVLPWSRIAVVGFVVVVAAGVWFILQRTSFGLQVRAVTQNRAMASCLGIRTKRIDALVFGLGSGIAGLGGVALSQLGNVGPELGQSYIIDSFMVVVLGGVDRLAGAVAAALGLGVVNKLIEPAAGAVLGKIAVLAFIILFIQRRPQGLFALKGRVEA